MSIKNFDFNNLSEDYLKSFKKPDIKELYILNKKYALLNSNINNYNSEANNRSAICFNTLYNITINENSDNFDDILHQIQYISKIDFIFLNKLNSFLLKIPIIDYWMEKFLDECKLTLKSIFSSIETIEKLIDYEFSVFEQHITDLKDIKECFSLSIRELELDLFTLYFKEKETINIDNNQLLEDIQSKVYSTNLSRLNLTQSLLQVSLIEDRIYNLRNQLYTLKTVTLPVWKNTLTIINTIKKDKNLKSKFKMIETLNNNNLSSLSSIIIDNFKNGIINPHLLNLSSQVVKEELINIKLEKDNNLKKNVDFFQNIDIIYQPK